MKLFLHCGHDKTGSSFLQSSIANSISILESSGIHYPSNSKIISAREGKISSGNAGLFFEGLDSFSDFKTESVLASGEKLFRLLPDPEYREKLFNFIDRFNVESVEILLFVRDPLEHISSSYQQSVKRGGYTGEISEFVSQYRHTKKVSDFVKFCVSSKFNLSVYNYSNVKSDLIGVFEEWLGIDRGTLVIPDMSVINRSLSLAELEFQKVVNSYFGREGAVVADALCQECPEVKSDIILLDEDSQRELVRRVSPFCQYVNSIVSPDGPGVYNLDVAKVEKTDDVFTFSKKQIATIAKALSSTIKK